MESIKISVEDFLKSRPNCKNFLHEFVKEAEDEINKKKDDYDKVKVFEKAKKLCEYDVANFKKSIFPGFKYKIELLKNNDPDYELLETSIKIDDSSKNSYTRKQLTIKQKTKGLKIYRVLSNEKCLTESSNSDQILLLHGTKAPNVEGILKTGFNPSQKGSYGPGVYLTNCFSCAWSYGNYFATEDNMIKHLRYFFVNSVPNAELHSQNNKLKKITSFEDYLSKEPSVKVYNYDLEQPIKIEESTLDMFDSHNKKISNGSFQKVEQAIIALAHHSLVVPAYLIEVEEKTNVADIVNGILYSCLKIERYTRNVDDFDTYRKTNRENNTKNKVSECSFSMIAEKLKEEISKNYHALIDRHTSALEEKTNSIMKELSFQLSSITDVNHDEKRKFSTELLEKGSDDYNFILRSIDNKSSKNLPKIKQLFRINPTDKNEVPNYKQKYLYLNGVEADKVKYFLTNGYPNDEDSLIEIDSELHQTTTILSLATYVGSSYCVVDNTIKKLSFVFVVASEENWKNRQGEEIIKDSRKNLIREGIFGNFENGVVRDLFDLVPAYLIIFELDDK